MPVQGWLVHHATAVLTQFMQDDATAGISAPEASAADDRAVGERGDSTMCVICWERPRCVSILAVLTRHGRRLVCSAVHQSEMLPPLLHSMLMNACLCCRQMANVPCGHLCSCPQCAAQVMMHTSTCPICRDPIQQVVQVYFS